MASKARAPSRIRRSLSRDTYSSKRFDNPATIEFAELACQQALSPASGVGGLRGGAKRGSSLNAPSLGAGHNRRVAVASSAQPPKVTIRDVANKAGVSISTVSHVFSGRRRISPETAARVQEAALALGYRANPSARSLRTGEFGLLGLVLRPRDAVAGSLAGTETFTRFSGAVAAATLATGRGLVHVPDLLNVDSQRVPMDGCIVEAPYGGDAVLAELRHRGVPVVSADVDPDRPDDAWSVRVDYGGAVTQLLERLDASGARSIGMVSGSEDNAWNRFSRQAYQAWCAGAGRPARLHSLYEGAGAAGARQLAGDMLTGADRPDALVVAATRFAVGVAEAAESAGLRVPEDLQLAALTDSDLARLHRPPITGLDLRMEELGKRSVALLLHRIQDPEPPHRQEVIRPEIRWRATTRATASAGTG